MYIAIDAGSSFLKLAKLKLQGENVSVLESERRAVKRVPDTQPYKYEYDIAGIVGQVRDYIDRAASAGNIEGILITAQMHGYVLRNNATGECSNYISWQDERCLAVHGGESYLDRLRRLIPAGLIARSGMRLKCEMALCNLYADAAERGLELSDGYELFTLGSYMINSLCGRNITHITSAVPTGFYDLQAGGVPNRELLELLGMGGLRLPEVTDGFSPCGEYRPAGAEAGIPVYPDVGDQQVCILGGGLDCGSLNINIGTATQMSSVCADWEPGFYDSIYELRPYFGGRFLRTVTKLPGGRSLQVIADFFADAVRTFAGVSMTPPQVWDIIMTIAGDMDATLEVKTGFFRGLLYNEGAIKGIDASNLNCRELASGAFADLARVYDGIIPVIDTAGEAGRIMICGKFGEVVREHLRGLPNARRYDIGLAPDAENSFRGLGMLVGRNKDIN